MSTTSGSAEGSSPLLGCGVSPLFLSFMEWGWGGKDLVTALNYLSHKEVRNGCQYSHISRRYHPA